MTIRLMQKRAKNPKKTKRPGVINIQAKMVDVQCGLVVHLTIKKTMSP